MTGPFDLAAHGRSDARRRAGGRTGRWTTCSPAPSPPRPTRRRSSPTAWIRASTRRRSTLTYRELERRRRKTAAGSFRALGVGKGDVVAIMLPNWWEFVVAAYALSRIGAVPNPLMHIFRERELRFMLGFADTKAIVVPKALPRPRLREDARRAEAGTAEARSMSSSSTAKATVPSSVSIMQLGREAGHGRRGNAAGDRRDGGADVHLGHDRRAEGRDALLQHADRLLRGARQALRPDADDVHLGSTPFGHMTGYAAVMIQALYYGSTCRPDRTSGSRRPAWRSWRARASPTMAAATPFLADICRVRRRRRAEAPRLTTFLCGGAQIPPVVIENARKLLDLNVSSLWGMTEALAGSLTEPERAAREVGDHRRARRRRRRTAHRRREPDSRCPTGQTGRLYFRGSQQFIGYYRKPGLDGRGAEGWFDTGDLAYMDAEGYIRIDGRTKDIIIRGGENVPVVEIESILYRHPKVADVAVVGFPDQRLGERSCAFLVMKEGQELDHGRPAPMDGNERRGQAVLARGGRGRSTAMPRTASGKIQKFVLRDKAAKHSED
jgi:cyclohexanecarboxylate-CoA ligase